MKKYLSYLPMLLGSVLLLTMLGSPAYAAEPHSRAEAVRVEITAVPSVGIAGFSGVYGVSTTGPAGGNDQASFSDPDGVTQYITVNAQKEAQTSGNVAPPAWDARVNLIALSSNDPALNFAFSASSSDPALSVATLQNYARCAPPADAQVLTSITAPQFFGNNLTEGVPVTETVTGAQLGLDQVSDADLTATLTQVTDTSDPMHASAKTVITIEGILRDASGQEAFSGTLATLTLGNVEAWCDDQPSPSPTPSPTVSPSPTLSPTVTPSPSSSVTPSPSETEVIPTDSPSPSDSVVPSITDDTPGGGDGNENGALPQTGTSLIVAITLGVLMLLAGASILFLHKRRSA